VTVCNCLQNTPDPACLRAGGHFAAEKRRKRREGIKRKKKNGQRGEEKNGRGGENKGKG